jgi:hypothetical protein
LTGNVRSADVMARAKVTPVEGHVAIGRRMATLSAHSCSVINTELLPSNTSGSETLNVAETAYDAEGRYFPSDYQFEAAPARPSWTTRRNRAFDRLVRAVLVYGVTAISRSSRRHQCW